MTTLTQFGPDAALSPAEQAILRAAPFNLDVDALRWVEETRARLTPEQRLCQLFNVLVSDDDLQAAQKAADLGVGAYTRFVGGNLDAAWHVTHALLEAAQVPPLISGDLEGGAIAMPFATQLPNQLGLAAAGDSAMSEQVVGVLAREARALGYNWSFTPVIDINAAFRSAIVATRSYGSEPETILTQALINLRTFQSQGIAATIKHWPGEGFDDRDQHLVTTLNPLDMDQWHASFGQLYRSMIEGGVLSVMAGHIALPAYAKANGVQGLETCRPASVSRLLNQQLLRQELGFNGVIVSDASSMAGLSSWDKRARVVVDVFNSGCDMLLFPSPSLEEDLAHLQQALSDGRVTWARMDEALLRVLGMKAALGLHQKTLEQRLPALSQAHQVVRQASHLDVEKNAASASITLVKDVHALLPLSAQRHKRIVVVTDPDRSGFAYQAPAPLILPALLAEHGFEVREFDPQNPPTAADTDLVLYILAQESLLTRSHIYLDWLRLHRGLRTSMRRYWQDLPCAMVSFGHPYYLYDAPRMPCMVNAYTAIEPVQRAVLRKLLGEEPFTASSPVDATCGLPDALY